MYSKRSVDQQNIPNFMACFERRVSKSLNLVQCYNSPIVFNSKHKLPSQNPQPFVKNHMRRQTELDFLVVEGIRSYLRHILPPKVHKAPVIKCKCHSI